MQTGLKDLLTTMEVCIKFMISCLLAVVFTILVIRRVHCEAVETFNITCDPKFNETDCHSKSLETIMDAVNSKAISDLEIRIQIHQLQLNTTLNFTNLSSLIIKGESAGMTNIICSHSGSSRAGIVIHGIKERLLLQNLNLSFCGTKIDGKTEEVDSKFYYSDFYSALTISHCKNVKIDNFVIERSEGLGLVMNSTQGDYVTITSATFKENKLPQSIDVIKVKGGGGAYILVNQSPKDDQLSPTVLLFKNCTFEDNIARTRHYRFIYNDALGELLTGYGRGGGAYVLISSGVRNIYASFSECRFLSNSAFFGGGLAVNIQGQINRRTQNVSVEITDTHFQQNGNDGKGSHTGFGGGMHISFHASDHVGGLSDAHLHLHHVSFDNNSAELGGAVFYISYRARSETFSNVNSMLFENCSFKYNRGHVGSAVAMTPYLYRKISSGFVVIPKFQNCNFSNNSVYIQSSLTDSHAQRIAGISTVYSSFYDIHFEGINTFYGNKGTAIHVVNGIVNFTKSDAKFFKNKGINGGALGLIGSSIVILGPRRRYEFLNNTAYHLGGAIYVSLMDTIDFISSRTCFIQYHSTDLSLTEQNTNITFVGNHAQNETAGHAIYATSMRPCQVVRQNGYTLIDASEVFGFDFGGNATSKIATDGAKLHSTKPSPLLIIPGQKYEHGVVITDDLGHTLKASFRVFMSYKNSRGIKLESTSAYVGEKIQLRGSPHQHTSLHLQAVSPRQNYIQLNVTLLDCPPGFKFDNKSSKCICGADIYVGLIRCDMDTYHSYILPGFWIGLVKTSNRTDLVSGRCPFCDYGKRIISNTSDSEFGVVLPRNYSNLNKVVCGDTRTGIACGKCRDGYTVHFHSPRFLCKPAEPVGCKLGWLFYILSELVPVTVVFITVLVLNISITSGVVNGFILFSQLLDTFDIDASGSISYPESAKRTIKGWIQRYRFIYGYFNFDFFDSETLSFCLRKNASALDMLAMKYVTIFYTLLLIVAVIWIMNKFGGRCCGKFCRITTMRTSVIHGISTFLVICYAMCIKVSLYLLVPMWLRKTGFKPPARVWLNGELLYFSKEHLPYALPAIFCLLTIGILPPALLLAYPLGNKVMTFFGCEFLSQKLSISSLKPLLDSIQGCFKDNMRFFAGLYFLYRWIIPLIHITANGFSTYCCALGGVLLFILTIHTICQPYVKRAHNIIDTLLFVNLILINSFSFFNYYKSHTQWGIRKGATLLPAIIQLVLIYLPLTVVGVYVLAVILKKFAQFRYSGLFDKVTAVFAAQMKANTLREVIESVSMLDEDSSKVEEEHIHNWLMEEEREFRNTHEYHARCECENKPLETYI